MTTGGSVPPAWDCLEKEADGVGSRIHEELAQLLRPHGGLRSPGDENSAQEGTSPPPLEAVSWAPLTQDRG